MKLHLAALASVGLVALSFAPTPLPVAQPALASSSEAQCFADGGIEYIKDGPNSICVYAEVDSKPGNMPDGYDGGALTTTQTTDTGHGNTGNKTETNTTCTGRKCP